MGDLVHARRDFISLEPVVGRHGRGLVREAGTVQVDELTCEGDSCPYTVRTQYSYDSFGNRTTTDYLGNLADNNDVNCPQRLCPDTPADPYGLSAPVPSGTSDWSTLLR